MNTRLRGNLQRFMWSIPLLLMTQGSEEWATSWLPVNSAVNVFPGPWLPQTAQYSTLFREQICEFKYNNTQSLHVHTWLWLQCPFFSHFIRNLYFSLTEKDQKYQFIIVLTGTSGGERIRNDQCMDLLMNEHTSSSFLHRS